MKKIMAILLLVSIVTVMLTACNTSDITTTNRNSEINLPPNPTDADYLQYIYEVNSSYFGSDETFNHKNVVSKSTHKSIDEKAPLMQTVKINGLMKELNYENTLYYPVQDYKVHCYSINDQEDCKVLIREDGSIFAILNDFDKIDILQTNTPEEVLPKIKEVVEQYVDLSRYKYIDMPYDSSKDEGGIGFGNYTFEFYNLVDGYKTDYLMISVDYFGNVYGLKIIDLRQHITELNIDKKLEDKLLELKFRDIFTTDKIEYISYKIDDRFFPQVVTREDGIYISYAGSARYTIKDTGQEIKSFLVEVLIPLDLITSK